MKNRILYLLIILLMVLITLKDGNYENIELRIVICAISLYCLHKGLNEEFWVNPYILFSVTPLSLLLYSESFAPTYLNALKSSTLLLALINMFAFIVGYEILKKKEYGEQQKCDNFEINESYNARMHILILSILGAVPVIFHYLKIAIPMRSFMGFFGYIAVAMAFKSHDRKNLIIAYLFMLVGYIEDFNKFKFLSLAITSIVCYEAYYVESQEQRRKVIYAIFMFALFMLFIAFPLKSFIRGGGSYIDFVNNAETISSSSFEYYNDRFNFNGPDFLKMPYMYLVSAWNNVQYVIETQDFRTYGLWTIKPLLTYIGLNTRFEAAYILIPETSFNTFTYITILFKDYGYWGSAFGSLLLGLYVSFSRRRFFKGASSFDTATYSLVCVATLQMYFSNHFFGLSYPFTIFIIGYIYKKIFRLE